MVINSCHIRQNAHFPTDNEYPRSHEAVKTEGGVILHNCDIFAIKIMSRNCYTIN